MRRVFADTFYFLALLNKNDADHEKAVRWSKSYRGQVLTTEWVLTELADGLATSRGRIAFSKTREKMLAEPAYQIKPLDMELYQQGIDMYAARVDKQWSLTDCISFIVMQREGLTEATTGDHHFEQAGFVALLK
jgi:predicted nucleic acid-binding protein